MPKKLEWIDATGRTVRLSAENVGRIISLCPSQTETLFALGLKDRVVGRTRYCEEPAAFVKSIPSVGGTKQVDISKIRSLDPDFILGEKEENPKQMIEALEEIAPTFVTEIKDHVSALKMIEDLGEIFQVKKSAICLVQEIRDLYAQIIPSAKSLKVAYFIWKGPWMIAGPDTFISSQLRAMGLEIWTPGTPGELRYPEIVTESLQGEGAPDLFFFSSEPYPFQRKEVTDWLVELGLDIALASKARLVDGALFSWYGSRMKQFPKYAEKVLRSLS